MFFEDETLLELECKMDMIERTLQLLNGNELEHLSDFEGRFDCNFLRDLFFFDDCMCSVAFSQI